MAATVGRARRHTLIYRNVATTTTLGAAFDDARLVSESWGPSGMLRRPCAHECRDKG